MAEIIYTDLSALMGILISIVALIISAIYYQRYKKVYLIVFILSISIYLYAVFYTWTIFENHNNLIMLMLIVSAILMIFLGNYFSKFKLKKDKMHTSLKEKEI